MPNDGAPIQKKITIEGLPVFAGNLLTASSEVFRTLDAPEDFVRFAKGLRGQFCIVVEDGARTVAITDFGCSRPVFYMRNTEGAEYRVSTRLADLIPWSKKKIRKEALFFYASRSGVGISPFYSDIEELFPATVTVFEGALRNSTTYIDWGDYLETRPIDPADAERRFIEIASDYLGAIVKGRGPVACLLSGGTDSALLAWLLRDMGLDSPCLTADYAWKRYSEFAGASASAKAFGARHERIVVTAATRRQAFFALNSKGQNAPCCQAQAPTFYQLAQHALGQGISTLITGDHADALFLGFDRFFRGFPQDTAGYTEASGALGTSEKLSRLYAKPRRPTQHDDLTQALGLNEDELFAWKEAMYADDCRDMRGWAERAPLHTLQQLEGQMWAGISWQNNFLPVTQAFDNPVEFVSPFYDIEMVKFAMALPVEYKFRDGNTKALLRQILSRVLGYSIVKRASPNPARIWRLLPDLRERNLQPAALKPLYDRLFRRNLTGLGRLWPEFDRVAALGVWMSQQPLER